MRWARKTWEYNVNNPRLKFDAAIEKTRKKNRLPDTPEGRAEAAYHEIMLLQGIERQAGLEKKASGGITMWTADMSADFIVGGEYTDFTFATVTTDKIEKEVLSEAHGIGKASGGSYKVGRVMFLGTPKGFRYAVRIRVTGVPFGSTVGAIESKARGARKVQWRELEFAPQA